PSPDDEQDEVGDDEGEEDLRGGRPRADPAPARDPPGADRAEAREEGEELGPEVEQPQVGAPDLRAVRGADGPDDPRREEGGGPDGPPETRILHEEELAQGRPREERGRQEA